MADPTAGATPEQLVLLNGPAMSPPPGVIPNFVDPPNLNSYWVLSLTLSLTFSTLFVLMRMYTRLFISRVTSWDDCESLRF